MCAAGAVWLIVVAIRGGWAVADPVASVLGGMAGMAALVLALRDQRENPAPTPTPPAPDRPPVAPLPAEPEREPIVPGDAGRYDPPPPGPPVVPEWVVDRAEAERVVAAVCRVTGHDNPSGTVGITTGLHGAGGFGKTTLAHMVRAHPQVREYFGGRVYEITVGRGVRGRAAVAAKVAEAIRFITGNTLDVGGDPVRAGEHLGRLLAERPRTLLVIDDVWEAEQLEPFLHGARDRCVRLVTTRNPAVLPSSMTPEDHITVDRMSWEQARSVLSHGLRPPPADRLVDALIEATGRWALLLRMANQVIEVQTATGMDPSRAAQVLLDRLRVRGPASEDPQTELCAEDLDDPVRRNTSVSASIRAATDLLPRGGERRFLELAWRKARPGHCANA